MNESSSNDRDRHESHQRTYSLAQIASKLDRPGSTVRTWKDQYNEYVEGSSIGKGRNKRYYGDAVRIFSLIDEMKSRNEPHELIQQTLAENVDQIIYTPDDEDRPPALMNEILDSYRDILEVVKSQENHIRELESYIKRSDADARQREIESEQRMTAIVGNLSQQLEQQQLYIDEKLEKRDQILMQSLRNSQELKTHMKEIAEQVAAKDERGFFAKLFGK